MYEIEATISNRFFDSFRVQNYSKIGYSSEVKEKIM